MLKHGVSHFCGGVYPLDFDVNLEVNNNCGVTCSFGNAKNKAPIEGLKTEKSQQTKDDDSVVTQSIHFQLLIQAAMFIPQIIFKGCLFSLRACEVIQ